MVHPCLSHTTVEPIEISASVRTVQMTLNYDLEKILLEEYAAPYWNLTFKGMGILRGSQDSHRRDHS